MENVMEKRAVQVRLMKTMEEKRLKTLGDKKKGALAEDEKEE